MKSVLFALLSGLVFGLGLIAGGMTDPSKVKGFLDVFGTWDPSLAFVMGGAIAVASVAFALARRRKKSWSGAPIVLPCGAAIDIRVIVGGMMLGAGWGLAGFCPGPALVAFGSGAAAAWWFVPAMLAGMVLHDEVWLRRAGRTPTAVSAAE